MLLRLWCRLAAVAPIRPLAWEPLYAVGAALEKDKKKRNGLLLMRPLEYKQSVTAEVYQKECWS